MRKPKLTGRQWMTAAKPARNRRSAEHMRMELEISDLTAAGDVLNWDQATYMPQGSVDGRSRQCAMLYSLAHERAVALIVLDGVWACRRPSHCGLLGDKPFRRGNCVNTEIVVPSADNAHETLRHPH
jgi:hypothetical protein